MEEKEQLEAIIREAHVRRRAQSQLFAFTGEQHIVFLNARIDVVFSTPFLMRLRKPLRRTEAQLGNAGNRGILGLHWSNILTIRELAALSQEVVAGYPGMGPSSLSLVMDVLTLFGLSLKETSESNDVISERDIALEASRLAGRLGI